MTTSETASTLTLLYLQNQDLSGLTPEELSDKYDEVYHLIKSKRDKNKKSGVKVLK